MHNKALLGQQYKRLLW